MVCMGIATIGYTAKIGGPLQAFQAKGNVTGTGIGSRGRGVAPSP